MDICDLFICMHHFIDEYNSFSKEITHTTFACSKLIIETLEQGLEYVQI